MKCKNCKEKIQNNQTIYIHKADIICPTQEGRKRIFCSELCAKSYYNLLKGGTHA